MDFLGSKYKEAQAIKTYNFLKFTNGISEGENKNLKVFTKNSHFSDEELENEPIKTDITNSNFLLDNDDAITYTFKKGKKSE